MAASTPQGVSVLKTLETIRKDPELRQSFVRTIVQWEKAARIVRPNLREEASGPLVDSVHLDNEVMQKELHDGTIFQFLYRSKIAREFVMSDPELPDHVWEPQTTRLLVRLARGARSAVIGGAYFGDHTILVAQEMARCGGTVHAFEPDSSQRSMLEHNVTLNALSNVRINGEGLWDSKREGLRLSGQDAYATMMEDDAGGDSTGISTVRLDDYLRAQHLTEVDLIMLDLEGAEQMALKGTGDFLTLPPGKAPNLVFEIHRNYVDWTHGLHRTEVVQWLTGLGYSVFAVRDFNANQDMKGSPVELIPCDSVYLEGPPHGFNMAAFKDTRLLSDDCFRIVRGVSPKLLLHKDPALYHPVGGMP
ncbi:MAG: FkbM family methyltransferase [Prosthecobacter sp.]|uniref:FkbM family methyltransferase n=1 Tax=Prosthecobacter sp. TaxID=1965333 RepID=UPI003BAFECA4